MNGPPLAPARPSGSRGGGREERESPLPRLHLITDEALLSAPDFAERAAGLCEAGGGEIALHVRGGGLNGAGLWAIAAACAESSARSGTWLFVNDRLDVGLGCGAQGVQLGSASFPPRTARALLGPSRWIGASVHSLEQAEEVVEGGADFVIAGTLYPTPSHPGRPGTGAGWLGGIVGLGVPVIGIGGIVPALVPEVLLAGAHGVAVLGGIWRAPRPVEALNAYLLAVRRTR